MLRDVYLMCLDIIGNSPTLALSLMHSADELSTYGKCHIDSKTLATKREIGKQIQDSIDIPR